MLLANMARQMQRPVFMPITVDFVGKISGSVVENPNIAKINGAASLLTPSAFSSEFVNGAGYNDYGGIQTQNSICSYRTDITNGVIPQHLFSFNLIEIFERKYGKIPATSGAGKVAWLKNNVSNLACNWYGYGSCPSGNKAYIKRWDGSAWTDVLSNISSSSTLLALAVSSLLTAIQSDGFAHFIAYPDASDGVTASTIYTDYVKLVLTLKN